MEDSDLDVVMWVIVKTFWADIKRLVDLLSSQEEATLGWNPDCRLHLDRLEIIANRKRGMKSLSATSLPR